MKLDVGKAPCGSCPYRRDELEISNAAAVNMLAALRRIREIDGPSALVDAAIAQAEAAGIKEAARVVISKLVKKRGLK